jgi:predicted hydrocarbon binding protein
MKAADFNLQRDMKLDFEKGITSFKESRLLIFDSDAIGVLRQNMIEMYGEENARTFFLRFGYQSGYADCMRLKVNYTFDQEVELLAAGPVIHTWEGIVQATPKEIRYDRQKGEFFMHGIWSNSYEADQHLSFNKPAQKPVCWSLMGYASGYATAFFGSKVVCMEPVCKGKGDDHCEFKIQPPAAWGDEAETYLRAFKMF